MNAPALAAKLDTAAELMIEWQDDPVQFVRDNFEIEPDPWQAKVLQDIRNHRRVAMHACKGPGKSAVEAWGLWWVLATNKDAQGFALSITADNLRDGLWKELATWYDRSEFLQATFDIYKTSIRSKLRPDTWWCTARSFPQQADKEQQANTLAGLHAKVVFIFCDEVGDYPNGVLAAAEAIFADPTATAYLVVAGNPTNRNGPLYRIVTVQAQRWAITAITGDPEDPKRSPRISVEWAQQLIDEYGRDHPWVQINVLGEFPDASEGQLIDINWVLRAQKRDAHVSAYRSDPHIWGLDGARAKLGDESVLIRRRGVMVYRPHHWRGLDGTKLGDQVSTLLIKSEKEGDPVDAVFCDVGGVGASAYDRLVFLGWGKIVVPVEFGAVASEPRYADKRTEMWWDMAQWLEHKPACLPPDDPVLREQLTGPMSWWGVRQRRSCLILESKDQMRERGIGSPDRADALCLTFAAPVAPRSKYAELDPTRRYSVQTEYNPMAPRGYPNGVIRLPTTHDPLKPR